VEFGTEEKFRNAPFLSKYTVVMYWAYTTMTTVGYGDISAVTVAERIAAIVGMIAGGFMFSLIISVISEVIANRDISSSTHTKKMQCVMQFIRDHKLPRDDRKECMDYFRMQQVKAYPDEDLLHEMPYMLRKRIVFHTYRNVIDMVPFFTHQPEMMKVEVCSRFQCSTFPPDTLVYQQGEAAGGLYVVGAGKVEILGTIDHSVNTFESSIVLAVLAQGSYFGEEVCIGLTMRENTIRCKIATTFYQLGPTDVAFCMELFPSFYYHLVANFGARGKKLEQRLEAVRKKYETKPMERSLSMDSLRPPPSKAHHLGKTASTGEMERRASEHEPSAPVPPWRPGSSLDDRDTPEASRRRYTSFVTMRGEVGEAPPYIPPRPRKDTSENPLKARSLKSFNYAIKSMSQPLHARLWSKSSTVLRKFSGKGSLARSVRTFSAAIPSGGWGKGSKEKVSRGSGKKRERTRLSQEEFEIKPVTNAEVEATVALLPPSGIHPQMQLAHALSGIPSLMSQEQSDHVVDMLREVVDRLDKQQGETPSKPGFLSRRSPSSDDEADATPDSYPAPMARTLSNASALTRGSRSRLVGSSPSSLKLDALEMSHMSLKESQERVQKELTRLTGAVEAVATAVRPPGLPVRGEGLGRASMGFNTSPINIPRSVAPTAPSQMQLPAGSFNLAHERVVVIRWA